MRRNSAPETSSYSSDGEWNATLQNYNYENRKLRPRIIDYEGVFYRYSNEEFNSHFSLLYSFENVPMNLNNLQQNRKSVVPFLHQLNIEESACLQSCSEPDKNNKLKHIKD